MNIYERGGVYSGSNLFFATRDTIWGLMDCSQIAVNSPFPAWALVQSHTQQSALLLPMTEEQICSHPLL